MKGKKSPSLYRVTIFYSSLRGFSSTDIAITLKRVGLCVVAAGHPTLAKEIAL